MSAATFAQILPLVPQLEPYLLDSTVTEVMVNTGGSRIFIERDGLSAYWVTDCRHLAVGLTWR